MKQLFLITVAVFLMGLLPAVAQQSLIFPINGGGGNNNNNNNNLDDEMLLPSEMMADSYFVRHELAYPVEVTHEDRSQVVLLAKAEILKALFSDRCRENNALVCHALQYHAGNW